MHTCKWPLSVFLAPRKPPVALTTLASNLIALAIIAYCAAMPVKAAEVGCTQEAIEFVQITSMRLDAGEQTFEALRIRHDGLVERARWNSLGFLLEYSEPSYFGSEIFNQVLSSAAFLKPPQLSKNDGALGRPSYRLEITALIPSGIDAVFMHQMPADLASLVEMLKSATRATSPQSGWYIWTNPYPAQGKVDVDLTGTGCDSAVTQALSRSLATGRMIIRADDSIQEFASGERASRIAFVARFSLGDLRFGILSTKR